MIRQPAVAGRFYPSDPQTLKRDVDRLLDSPTAQERARAVIVPHAGYVYSGAVAGAVFAATEVPRSIVLLGPNHHGLGPAIAVSGADAWDTPLGRVPIDSPLRQRLLECRADLQVDDSAHEHEHSLEVMLPFLLRRRADISIVPMAVGRLDLDHCLAFGTSLARELKTCCDDVLLLASSDMNHFSTAETTTRLDNLAIKAMTDYDPSQLYRVVREKGISMCGVLPTIVVMQAAKELGASICRLVRYSHSGQINGDNSRVVGYAGLTLH